MQSMANDLARLLLLDKSNCERFIVIGLPMEGENDIKRAFKVTVNVGGKRVNVLPIFFSRKKDQEQVVHIDTLEPEVSTLFRNFMDDYGIDEMPNAFQARCVRFRRTGDFAVGMWRVSARKGTGTIMKSNL